MTPPADADVLIPLSPLDTMMGHLGLTAVYVFPPPKQSASPYDLDRVRASLITTIEDDYPLFVGELSTDPTTGAYSIRQTPKTRAGGAQAIPFELDPNSQLTTDEAVRHPPMSLLLARDGSELIALKATLLSDGGLAIGFNSRHALLDGEGLFTFMNVWAMHYRGVRANDRLVVNHDRHLLMPRGIGTKLPHRKCTQIQALQPEAPASVETTMGGAPPTELPQTDQKQFHLTPQQLKTFKAKVSQGLDEGQYVSTIDTVTALFSVLITRARGHAKDVKILTTVNGRTRFNPRLPPNYAGNCIFSASSSHSAQEMASVSVETIRRVALSLRTSLLRLDDEFLRDAIEFIAPKDGRWTQTPAGSDSFFGTDIMFTSWANMGMYKADFGAGTPVYAGPPTLPVCDGLVFILEAMNHATGLDVLLLLESSVMDKVTELWNACELFRP